VKTSTEECDPPNTVGCDASCKARAICNLTGEWAMKVNVPVTWGDDAGALANSANVAAANPTTTVDPPVDQARRHADEHDVHGDASSLRHPDSRLRDDGRPPE